MLPLRDAYCNVLILSIFSFQLKSTLKMGKKEKERGRAEVDLELDVHVDVKRKKKKRNKHKHEQSPENININEFNERFAQEGHVRSKSAGGVKKKKKERQSGLSRTDVEDTEDKILEGTNAVQLKTVKERKKRKKKLQVDATPTSDEQENKVEDKEKEATREIEKVKKKKKRKQRDHDIVIENKQVFDDTDSPKEKRSKTDDEIGSRLTLVDEVVDLDANQRKTMKKKKRKDRDDYSEKIDSLEAIHPGVVESESHIEPEKRIKKVKKRKEHKHKDRGLETDGDAYEKRSEKDACDHLNGNKSDQTTPVVGQWGTAQFDSSERQNKFFRLLGGMKSHGTGVVPGAAKQGKKSLFGGLAALIPKTGKSAMTNEQQSDWQTKMESQFDKALTYKVQRGGGLGFEKPPEEGKKFHINIHKSNSIKFDD